MEINDVIPGFRFIFMVYVRCPPCIFVCIVVSLPVAVMKYIGNLRRKGWFQFTALGYRPLLQGGQRGRNLEKLATSHAQSGRKQRAISARCYPAPFLSSTHPVQDPYQLSFVQISLPQWSHRDNSPSNILRAYLPLDLDLVSLTRNTNHHSF